jgi:hypothetical protein
MSQGNPAKGPLLALVPLLAATALAGCITDSAQPNVLPGQGLLPTLPMLGFDPAVLIDGDRSGGEPSILVDHNNHYYVTAPAGMVATTFNSIVDPTTAQAQGPHNRQSFIWKSEDLGATWRILATFEVPGGPAVRPDGTFGGADTDLAVDDCNTLTYTDLWLGNIAVSHSDDGGATWIGTPYTGLLPILDRQWLAAGNECGEVFLLYQTFYQQVWVLRSTDKGMTWPEQNLVLDCNGPNPLAAVEGCYAFDGNLHWDRATDSLYFVAGSADNRGMSIFRSSDDAATWTRADVPVEGDLSLIPAIATDNAGNVYAVGAFGTGDDFSIFWTRSLDQGATYSDAEVMSSAPGVGTEVFPWVAAGDAGKVAIAWYGNDETVASTNDVEGEWFVFLAATGDATAEQVVWSTGKMSEKPMHRGEVCDQGLFCTLPQPLGTRGNRNLADFFEIAIDREGRVVAAWADDTETEEIFTSRPWFGRQGEGMVFAAPAAHGETCRAGARC